MKPGVARPAAAVSVGVLVGLGAWAVFRSPAGVERVLVIVAIALAGTAAALCLKAIINGSAGALADQEAAEASTKERLRALEASIASREAMLASMQEGIVLFGPDERVAYANPAARDLLGRRLTDASEVTPQVLREAMLSVGEGQPSARASFETTGRAVEALVLRAEPPGAKLIVARDITSSKRTDQLRRDFVANASHELKTPVSSILALAATLEQASGDPDAQRRFLDRLEMEAERMSRLVADLLDLSRLESGQPESRPVRLDVVAMEEATKLAPRALRADLELTVDETQEVVVAGSDSDLALMVHNLLDNAIRYTPRGGKVTLAVRRCDGYAEMEVSDTGIGIPSADLDRVFERFYRVDAARSRETGGTGLGLSIVRHVAEAHSGEVKVRSALGSGSTFVVKLPSVAS